MSGRGGAYLFGFMHSFAIEFLHWKEERVELREKRREAVSNASPHRMSHLGSAVALGVGGWWGGSAGAAVWVILEKEVCVRVRGGQASGGNVATKPG